MPYNLEYKVENENRYKSVGEAIIGETLQRNRINFKYEKQLLVEDKKPNDTEKDRLWYPDFYLEDLGIVIEYIGRDDPDYREGVERKTEIYEKIGLKVIKVYGEDVFQNRHRRSDFEYNLMMAIFHKVNESRGKGLKKGNLETNVVGGYKYKSGVAA